MRNSEGKSSGDVMTFRRLQEEMYRNEESRIKNAKIY